jgi:hypothetical protein
VSFRLRVALDMVHEDAETDVATLQCCLDEAPWWRASLVAYLGGFRIARPIRPHPDASHRHTVVATDLLLAVTVAAYTSQPHAGRPAPRRPPPLRPSTPGPPAQHPPVPHWTARRRTTTNRATTNQPAMRHGLAGPPGGFCSRPPPSWCSPSPLPPRTR